MSNSFGQFPFNTISGKTGDAEGAPITIRKGDLMQIHLYNASEKTHSMHLHGQDLTLVDINGHPVTPAPKLLRPSHPASFSPSSSAPTTRATGSFTARSPLTSPTT